MKLLSTILLAISLSACAFDSPLLANRVACTVAKDDAFVVSQYGPIGITGKIAKQDTAVICK